MILKKPFYVEKYPNFNTRELRNRIKVIALFDGYLHEHRKVLEHLAIEWRKKLESYVSYTLQEKLFSFEEEETPDGLSRYAGQA